MSNQELPKFSPFTKWTESYLDSIQDWLNIVRGRKFYAGCRCECCDSKKRPLANVKCQCGVHP